MPTKPVPLFKQFECHADRVTDIQEEMAAIIRRYQDRLSLMGDRFDPTDLMIVAGTMGRLQDATFTVQNYMEPNAVRARIGFPLVRVSRKDMKALEATISRITAWQKELRIADSVHLEEVKREGTTFYADTRRLLRKFKIVVRAHVTLVDSNTRRR